MKIFVSIASYRDPELIPTIQDCIRKSSNPDKIRIGVAWQHSKDEPKPKGVGLIDINHLDSRGACWARYRVQQELYNGEDYFLQVDSHMRFTEGWDVVLKDMLSRCDSDKPVLSSYMGRYNPDKYKDSQFLEEKTWGISSKKFLNKSSIPAARPHLIKDMKKPMLNRFMAGGLVFAKGEFVESVPYDPEIYFIGEEISLAVRSYTHGYDIFVPDKPIVLHEYGRKGKPKHWTDHTIKNKKKDEAWVSMQLSGKKRCDFILTADEKEVQNKAGKWGFGKERTRGQYEKFAGILFRKKYIHPDTFEKGHSEDLGHWEYVKPVISKNKKYIVSYTLKRTESIQDESQYCCRIAMLDKNGEVIKVDNLTGKSLDILRRKEEKHMYEVVETNKVPKSVAIWPYSNSKGWLDRIVKPLEVSDL